MPDPAAEAKDTIPGFAAAWESAKQEAAESQGETSPPSEPADAGAGEAAEPNPAPVEAEDDGRTDATEQESGDSTTEEPNPEGDEPAAEAPADFDPVLKTLSSEEQEGLRAWSPEARKALAKRLRSADTAVQAANKRAKEAEKSAEAFDKLAPPDKKALRERIWKMLADEEKGATEAVAAAPQPAKRPRIEDFHTADDYESAMDKWEESREERILSRVESKVKVELTAEQTAIGKVENTLKAWRAAQGDAVTDAEFDTAAKALGRALARRRQANPDWHKSYRDEQAVESVEAAIEAMRSTAPKAQVPARQPNPAPRRVQAASVPTTRGAPQRAVTTPAWEKEGRDPTLSEAWAAAEEEATQGTRPTARNGAVR